MVDNETHVEKSIGRHSTLLDDLDNARVRAPEEDTRDDRPSRSPRSCRGECPKDHCDAPVRRHTVERDGTSVEYQRCSNGHFVRERLLDTLADRVVSATILGP